MAIMLALNLRSLRVRALTVVPGERDSCARIGKMRCGWCRWRTAVTFWWRAGRSIRFVPEIDYGGVLARADGLANIGTAEEQVPKPTRAGRRT